MEPVVSELKGKYAGVLEVKKIDLFQEPAAADKYSIRVVPTLILEDAEGNVLEKVEGFMSLEQIEAMLEKHGIGPKGEC